MNKLVGLKLTNGETVLGYVVGENENETVLQNALTIKHIWDDMPPSIYATPSCPLSYGESFLAVVRNQIVAVFKPSETLSEYYEKSINSMLDENEEDLDMVETELPLPTTLANTGGIVH